MTRKRVGVLMSGRGSNMEALLAAASDPAFPAEIALVMSNNADAGGLATAARQGVTTAVVDHRPYGKDRESFERALDARMRDAGVDLVCLAGFMRVLTPVFVGAWDGRLLNIHPSLLPAYTGLHTHERALNDGVRVHGCTVHFVTPVLDVGPIIAQAVVPVVSGDDPDALAARVLRQEHQLYPRALELIASGAAWLENGRVAYRDAAAAARATLFDPTP
ncbi:phosphoribosylglycinamide formyltransferase [Camelimonas fluminis]|uniref:Phosphoribosylglycinamide formyltransferase n=1 Tax=Camelimonas fluminis TaxID=1576911 RepID=A0ABV7UE29_9HYPH|nr:phosphoribosylglycinamide formyltransferase [Camelimonas fluminis]GHE52582.1 phosphoribosylglycinamide formyltransferase [Camelimonas fluminis]